MKTPSTKNYSLNIVDNILVLIAVTLFLSGLILGFPVLKTVIMARYGSLSDYGSVGSYIGGIVGSLWSFAGIILFFIAIRLQKKELELQIQELKETKETFQIQNFESTFFNLLNRQNEILQSIEYDYNPKINMPNLFEKNQNGLEFFVYSTTIFRSLYRYCKSNNQAEKDGARQIWGLCDIDRSQLDELEIKLKSSLSEYDFVAELYLYFMNQYYQQFGHYMRHFYNILKYIRSNQSKLPNEKIKQYTSILKSQLSSAELFFIYYNGFAFPKMKEMIEEFNLNEHLRTSDLLSPAHDEFYKSKTRKEWTH